VTRADEGATPERRVAFRVLRRVAEGAYADRAFASEAKREGLDPGPRAQAHRLAFGSVQRRRTLDWLIDEELDRPTGLEPAVRDVMRIGAYELAYSDGVPASAAVDQAVRLARGLPGVPRRVVARAGLVNAVLRKVATRAAERLATLTDDDAAAAAVAHSVPDWIAERLYAGLGAQDARGVLSCANAPAESSLRWNPLRGPRDVFEAMLPPGWRRDADLDDAYIVAGQFALEDSPVWERGLAMGQSRASMLPALALAPRPGERILDLCAAPGAKATHLAALTANQAEIVCVEPHAARASGLRVLAERMGARVRVVEGDGRTVALDGLFDAALVDPPCTGLGVLSARPDARWRRDEADIDQLCALQGALLARAASVVRPGGRIVYSTCTLLPEENEAIVHASGLEIVPLRDRFPRFAHPRLHGALLTLPARDGTDGFFVAGLRVPNG
jgi:16S rRNA (cytosine967-C5)-methyltransferase